jgi:hypothetical protein
MLIDFQLLSRAASDFLREGGRVLTMKEKMQK